MIPVIDFGRLGIIGLKLLMFVTFATYFYRHLDILTSELSNILGYVKTLLGEFSSIDLGCFFDGLGGVDFLNSLINQFIFIATFTISAIATSLSYKYIIFFFGLLMKA